jgi:hypothetical protein
MEKTLLDEWDVADALAKKLYNVGFVNEDDAPVYVAEVERVEGNKITLTTTDGAKFHIICEKADGAKTVGR